MSSKQLPKQLLFGKLLKNRPFHGTKKQWRDKVTKWHNAEKRTPALLTQHLRKGTFSAFVEDVSDDRETTPEVIVL